MSNNNQSSVEWLENEFASLYFDYLTGLIDNKEYNERHKVIMEQAKAMHKEEIKMTAIKCHFQGTRQISKTSEEYIQYGEQYYNETFGGEDEQQ